MLIFPMVPAFCLGAGIPEMFPLLWKGNFFIFETFQGLVKLHLHVPQASLVNFMGELGHHRVK